MVWLHSEAWLGEPMLHMIRAKDVATYHVGGRSLTTLIKFCKLLTTYLSTVDIGERIPLLFLRESLHTVDFSST